MTAARLPANPSTADFDALHHDLPAWPDFLAGQRAR